MRAPAASSGGTSDNLQQTPCHSVPHVPGTGFQVSGTGHRVPGTGAGPTPGTEHRAPKTEPGQCGACILYPASCILHPLNVSTPFDTVSIRVDRPLPEAAWEAPPPVPAGVHSIGHFRPLFKSPDSLNKYGRVFRSIIRAFLRVPGTGAGPTPGTGCRGCLTLFW